MPTKEDHIPIEKQNKKGCTDLPDAQFNCFRIPKNQIVTKCNKQFDLDTHLYGEEIVKEDITDLHNKYKVEGINYEIFGEMKDDLFAELIECFKNSDVPKRRFLRDLNR